MKSIAYPDAIRMVRDSSGMTRAERAELARSRLNELVAYARLHSPYMAEKYKHIGDEFTLEDLPVSNKKELQEHFDDWVTDRAATRARVMAYASQQKQKGLFLDAYTTISTSGSTGEPFVMLRDDYHNKIHGALVNLRLIGQSRADALNPRNGRIASVIVTNPSVSSYSSFLKAKNAVPEFSHNMAAIDIRQSIGSIVSQLNDFQPTAITGYPSIINVLAVEQEQGRLHIKPTCIACSAEPLSEQAGANISRVFGCDVLNNYCMTEGGEIAMCGGECGNLHLNDDWILVEPIDQNGKPAAPGKYSDAALITDLSNFICPIIRYHVSDRIIIEESDCCCGNSLPILRISGRVIQCFKLCGSTFLPFSLIDALQNLSGVIDYQIARIARDTMELRLLTNDQIPFADIAREAERAAREQLELCGCHEGVIRVSQRLGDNNKNTGKRAAVVDEVTDDD